MRHDDNGEKDKLLCEKTQKKEKTFPTAPEK
jgi:hypothetical protein